MGKIWRRKRTLGRKSKRKRAKRRREMRREMTKMR